MKKETFDRLSEFVEYDKDRILEEASLFVIPSLDMENYELVEDIRELCFHSYLLALREAYSRDTE